MTAEQFLFYEMRIVSRLYQEGRPPDDIIASVKRDNLFQYPTERELPRLARACHRRLVALGNDRLIRHLATAPAAVAKQINLYAMMRDNRLAREFMVNLVGEKYRLRDYSFTRQDINVFFLRLQEQNEDVAAWSDKTIVKLKGVLKKCLLETEMLINPRDTVLNPILISAELESGIRENSDLSALAAFNCFR